jgi:hypothetical protein
MAPESYLRSNVPLIFVSAASEIAFVSGIDLTTAATLTVRKQRRKRM